MPCETPKSCIARQLARLFVLVVFYQGFSPAVFLHHHLSFYHGPVLALVFGVDPATWSFERLDTDQYLPIRMFCWPSISLLYKYSDLRFDNGRSWLCWR